MIELENISAGYGRKNIISDISLGLSKGRLISVIGVNGSGKSTLLKTIVGILPSSSGRIILDGKSAAEQSRQDIAKKISYLAQGKNIPDMTVEQMVLHGRFPHLSYPRRYSTQDHTIANMAMKQMGIADMADRPLSALSGGMRQKAYIAMALAQDTEYILLDEPTTYLDIAGQLELMKTLRTLADHGKSIVTVMHDLPLAFSFSDCIVVMSNGTIHAVGTPREICDSDIVNQIFGVRIYSERDNGFYYKIL